MKKGFTLIELLLVIGIIAILAAIVIVAINPAKQLADARNVSRASGVNTVLNAISQYALDNAAYPACLNDTGAVTATAVDSCGTLTTDLASDYISAIPTDPSDSSHYQVSKLAGANGRVTVSAPNAENGETISVSR
jgi:type IV pilus assembly protein PilA